MPSSFSHPSRVSSSRSRTSFARKTPPLKSTCVGHAKPLVPRRTLPCSAVDACCRKNRARCFVIAASAA